MIFGPSLVALILLGIASAASLVPAKISGDVWTALPATVLPCQRYSAYGYIDGGPCRTLVYSPSTPKYQAIMAKVAALLGVDVHPLASNADAAAFVMDSLGSVPISYMVNFKDMPEVSSHFNVSVHPDSVYYDLWTNTTLSRLQYAEDPMYLNSGVYPGIIGLQQSLDSAIGGMDFQMDVGAVPWNPPAGSDEPSPNSKAAVPAKLLLQVDASPAVMPLCGAIMAVLSTVLLVSEKQRGLLAQLRSLGLLESAYWLSWLLVFLPVCLLSGFATVAVGYLLDLAVFTYVDPSLMGMMLALQLAACTCFGMAMAALVSSPRVLTGVASLTVLLALIMSVVLSLARQLSDIYYKPSVFYSIVVLSQPWVHFSAFTQSVMTMASQSFASGSLHGTYGWANLGSRYPDGDVYTSQAPGVAYIWSMLGLMAAWTVFAWLAGQCCSPSQGGGLPVYFVFLPSYWQGTFVRRDVMQGDTLREVLLASERDGSVRLQKVTKAYGKNTAVKEVTLDIPANAVTAVVGANGCGKTTLLGVITGKFTPTYGAAYVMGHDVSEDPARVRSMVGLCAQENVLWSELSAWQHGLLYCAFKNVEPAERASHIAELLKGVSLADVQHAMAATFSGGMMRRLCVALSVIGSPSIVVIDEGSAGLDPLARRDLWKFIHELRAPGRIILITTHSMEEANYLADNVVIMANARVRAVGTPTFLKNRYTAGYNVSILTKPATTEAVERLVKAHMPTVRIMKAAGVGADGSDLSESGATTGHVSLSVPHLQASQLAAFLHVLQDLVAATRAGTEQRTPILDFSVANSGLDEVYMAVAHTERGINVGANEGSMQIAPAAKVLDDLRIVSRLGDVLHNKGVQVVEGEDVEVAERPHIPMDVEEHGGAAGVDAPALELASRQPSPAHGEPLSGEAEQASHAALEKGTAVGREVSVPMPAKHDYRAPQEGASLLQQVIAIVWLRAVVLLRSRKLLIAVHCVYVALMLVVVLFALLVSGLNPNAMPVCPGAIYAPSGYPYGGMSQEYNPRQVCNRTLMLDLLAQGGLAHHVVGSANERWWYQGQHPQGWVLDAGANDDTALNSITAGVTGFSLFKPSCVPGVCNGWGNVKPSDVRLLPDWLKGSAAQYGWGPRRGSLWVEQEQGGHPLDQYNFLSNNLTASSQYVMLKDSTTLPGPYGTAITAGMPPRERLLMAQSSATQHSISQQHRCPGFPKITTIACSMDQGIEWTDQLFPDAALQVLASDPAAPTPTLHLNARVYAVTGLSYSMWSRGYYDTPNGQELVFTYQNGLNTSAWVAFQIQSYAHSPWETSSMHQFREAGQFDDDDRSGGMYLLQQPPVGPYALANGLANALWRTSLNASDADSPFIYATLIRFPEVLFPKVGMGAVGPNNFILPLLSMISVVLLSNVVVDEKTEKQYSIMRVAGLRPEAYWLGNMAWSAMMTLYWMGMCFIIGAAVGAQFAKFASTGFVLLTLLCMAIAQGGYAALLGLVLRSGNVSRLVSVLTAVLVTAITPFMSVPFSNGLAWVPMLNFSLLLQYMARFGGGLLPDDNPMRMPLLLWLAALVITGAASYALAMYLHAVLPNPGVQVTATEHPLFPLRALARLIRTGHCRQQPELAGDQHLLAHMVESGSPLPALPVSADDPGVELAGEVSRVLAAPHPADLAPVVFHDLCVTYPASGGRPPTKAVRNLSFMVKRGESLALLGSNGAGKTTALSALSGFITPTSGQVFVQGLDTSRERAALCSRLGICTQHDIVWDSLTVHQHIQLFASLKGVPREVHRAAVQQLAEACELDGDVLHQSATETSGGQRRRLSIALALIGAPPVIVLDEPSSSLSPDVRQSVWQIINAQRQSGRTLIICTHAMDEAAALSDRIGIMALGRMRVLGTRAALTSQWGGGMLVTLTLKTGVRDVGLVTAFVKDCLCPDAKLLSHVGDSASYMLPIAVGQDASATSIARVFEVLTRATNATLRQPSPGAELIAQFAVGQQSLEEVFSRVVHAAEAEEQAVLNAQSGRAE